MKSLFFMSLVIILTVISCISLLVWKSVNSYLDACDKYYTTIGLLEYMSVEYPNEDYVDLSMLDSLQNFDFEQITNHEQVLFFDKNNRALGYIDEFERHDNLAKYKDNVVLISRVVFDVTETKDVNVSSMWVVNALYSTTDVVNKPIKLDGVKDFLSQYEPGSYEKTIIFYGEKTKYGRSWERNYTLVPLTHTSLIKNEEIDSKQLLIEDITNHEDDFDLSQDSLYSRIANTLYVSRHSDYVVDILVKFI